MGIVITDTRPHAAPPVQVFAPAERGACCICGSSDGSLMSVGRHPESPLQAHEWCYQQAGGVFEQLARINRELANVAATPSIVLRELNGDLLESLHMTVATILAKAK